MHTFKRDYVSVHELHDAESVLAQLGDWIDDYNRQAPHSALGMRSPADYRAVTSASRELTPPICLVNWGAEHNLHHHRQARRAYPPAQEVLVARIAAASHASVGLRNQSACNPTRARGNLLFKRSISGSLRAL